MNISLKSFGIIMYKSFQQMLQWSTKLSDFFAMFQQFFVKFICMISNAII